MNKMLFIIKCHVQFPHLFQVRVEVETCENLRPMANNSNAKGMAASYASGGQYGFSDKVVDGITLTVNSVILTLKSHAFIASFQVHSNLDITNLDIVNFPI